MKLLKSGEEHKRHLAHLALKECIEKQIMISIQKAWKAKVSFTIDTIGHNKKKR